MPDKKRQPKHGKPKSQQPKVSPVKQRAPDQDTAIEETLVAGTLPEEDRRAPDVAPAVAPDVGVPVVVVSEIPPIALQPRAEASDVTPTGNSPTPTDKLIAAAETPVVPAVPPSFMQGVTQGAQEWHHNVSSLLHALPAGSRVHFTRGDDIATPDKWSVYRGPGEHGGNHGEGKTLARAIRVIGSKYEHALDENQQQTSKMVHVDEAGVPIPAE